ncbi:MAG: chromate efflux transporter [Armatimonadota bacterium]|nr:chromate efflux transporter [Armatimonadota bacterium]
MPDLVRLFLKLGVTAFGGPAAHIAMMRDEVVTRHRWLSDQEFLDLVGAVNLIPGPNSTEMAIHIGYRQAGWRGLVAAGVSFITPAMLIVTVLAWAYVRFGTTPEAGRLFYGIKPVIIAVVVQALWALGRAAAKDAVTAAVGLAALVLYFTGANEIGLLAAAGLGVAGVKNARRLGGGVGLGAVIGWLASLVTRADTAQTVRTAQIAPAVPAALAAVPFALDRLFLIFLKIGAVLYGSGYVLLAFLRADFVDRLGWLTDQQLLDAVAIGQFTPGPVFTTATFIGYLLGGVPAAMLATVGIFLPAFVFVAASHPWIPRMRRSPWAGALLDGVNVASLALMAGVTWRLGRAAIVDPLTAVLAVAAFVVLVRMRVNAAWLVLGGAAIGTIVHGSM